MYIINIHLNIHIHNAITSPQPIPEESVSLSWSDTGGYLFCMHDMRVLMVEKGDACQTRPGPPYPAGPNTMYTHSTHTNTHRMMRMHQKERA